MGNNKVRLGIDAPHGVDILRDNAQTRTPKIEESKRETV
jgi:sRNA-binding carbon storage regulator CsrA